MRNLRGIDGKQQILQKLRSGADAAAWQRMALTLAGRYEPELYERLAGQPSPEAPGDGSDGEKAGTRNRPECSRRENAPERRRSRDDRGMAGQNGADGARPRGIFAVRQRYRLRGGVDAGVCAGGGGAGGGDENAAGDRIGLRTLPAGGVRGRTGAGAAGGGVDERPERLCALLLILRRGVRRYARFRLLLLLHRKCLQMKTPPVIESGCGRFRLEAFADGQEQARLDGMFETVRAGYRLLSARYPDHVRVLGERDPENKLERPERRPLEGQKEEKDEKL